MPLGKGTVYGLEHLLPPHFSLVRVNDILKEGVSDYTYDPAGHPPHLDDDYKS
jgi:hypothetical protein